MKNLITYLTNLIKKDKSVKLTDLHEAIGKIANGRYFTVGVQMGGKGDPTYKGIKLKAYIDGHNHQEAATIKELCELFKTNHELTPIKEVLI